MNLLTITQEFLFLFSAASAGKIPNGWKLERKLKVFKSERNSFKRNRE